MGTDGLTFGCVHATLPYKRMSLDWNRSVDDFDICQEAKWLIGFWIEQGVAYPAKKPSSWAKTAPISFWSARQRDRIAFQIEHIRHWEITEGSYAHLENEEATWYVDPPYQRPTSGGHYRCGSKDIDFDHLGTWCETREGQAIVCESSSADWLPFRFLLSTSTSGAWAGTPKNKERGAVEKRTFDEMIWTNHWEDLPWIEQSHSAR